MPSLLDNYKGSYATIGDAKAAMNNGTFANANPYSSPATSVPSAPTGGTPSSFSATMGMTAVQPLVNMPAPTMQKPQMPSIDVNGITQRITGDYQNQLAAQKQAIEQELAKIQQGNALAVTQNQNALQDELNKLGQQKTLNDQTAINLQNRRGGFYSGGLDYQLGNIARGTTEAIGTAQRDITARNADLWSKNSLAAAQAAENIKLLETQAPDKIRSLIQQEIDRQRGVNIQEAGITGQYNGAPTMAKTIADQNFGIQEGQLTGNYVSPETKAIQQQMAANSAAYATASPEEQARLHQANLDLAAKIGLTDTTGNGDYSGNISTPTVQAQQLDQQKVQQAWDNEFKNQQFDYQKASDLWERTFKEKTFDQNVKQFAANLGADYAKMSQAQQQFTAEMAFKQKAQQLEQDNLTAKTTQANQEKMQKEAQGLTDGLRAGQLTPAQALKQIEEDTQLGFYSPQEAAYLKSILQTITPNLPSSQPKELTKEQQATIPTDNAIDKEWVAAGKPGGMLDYRSWYKDPNGKTAGVPFDRWMQLYGPKIG